MVSIYDNIILHLHPQFHFISRYHFLAAIRAKLSLAKSICLLGMVIVSDLDPLRGFQAYSMVSVFIQTGLYAKSIVHLEPFLVCQPKYVHRTYWSLLFGLQYFTSIWRKLGLVELGEKITLNQQVHKSFHFIKPLGTN